MKGLRCARSSLSLSLFYHNHFSHHCARIQLSINTFHFENWKTIMYNYLANDHHDLFLENLLPSCKVLNINPPRKRRQPQETNWKQKFQKPQNENFCLTYLNTENKRNFHFLSSGQRLKSQMNYAKKDCQTCQIF